MDIFKFVPNASTVFGEGRPVEDYSDISWIERYREFGEFTMRSEPGSGLRSFLPEGTFLSHTDTQEIMVVENHEIQDDDDGNAELVITGRSLDVILEGRIIGANRDWSGTSISLPNYTIPSNYTWIQAGNLINDHILAGSVTNPEDAFPNVQALPFVVPPGTQEERLIAWGDLDVKVREILAIDNLGMRTIRPGPTATTAYLLIYAANDVSDKISFSIDDDDLEKGNYLWSNKLEKNACIVRGRWVTVLVDDNASGYQRRTMLVDGNDIDGDYNTAPTGGTLTSVTALMEAKGREELAKRNPISIVGVEVAKNSGSNIYREDYQLGDIVSVKGNYNTETTMQVIEHVEIEDDTGRISYPTLSKDYS